MKRVSISASRKHLIATLRNAVEELEKSSTSTVEHIIYGARDNNDGDEVVIQFDNEDMEDRDDLPDKTIIVDWDTDA